MKLSQRKYLIERLMKTDTIPEKIVDKMNNTKWESIVQDSINVIKTLAATKRIKPQEKRLQKRKRAELKSLEKGTGMRFRSTFPTRKKVNYKADSSLIHEPYEWVRQ